MIGLQEILEEMAKSPYRNVDGWDKAFRNFGRDDFSLIFFCGIGTFAGRVKNDVFYITPIKEIHRDGDAI